MLSIAPPWMRGGVSPLAPDSPLRPGIDGHDIVVELFSGAIYVGRCADWCDYSLRLHLWGPDAGAPPLLVDLSDVARVRKVGPYISDEARAVREQQDGRRPAVFLDRHQEQPS
jgi:hypothetical protein